VAAAAPPPPPRVHVAPWPPSPSPSPDTPRVFWGTEELAVVGGTTVTPELTTDRNGS
jgi:hypothetical protein